MTPQATVTIPAGQTSTTFSYTTNDVTTQQTGSVSAQNAIGYTGIKVNGVTSLTGANTVIGGNALGGSVTVAAAVAVDTTVHVVSTDASVTATDVVIPAGKSNVTFSFATSAVGHSTSVTLTASRVGTSKSKTVTVTP